MSSAPSPTERQDLRIDLNKPLETPHDEDDGPGAALGPLAAVWRRGSRLVRSKNSLSLLDQAVVSATNFGTTIVVGRTCIPAELGNYSLALTILVLCAAVGEGLVVYPYAIQRTRLGRAGQTEYAGAVLVLFAGLALTAVGLLLAGAAACHLLGGERTALGAVLGVLACIVPFSLVRELGRRMSIAHLRMDWVLKLDLMVALLQGAGLMVLVVTDRLSAATAYVAVGLACAIGGGLWLRAFRSEVAFPRGAQLWRLCIWNLSMGKWIFFIQMMGLINGYFIQWVVAGVSGEAALGVYAAAITLVMLTNPFILGITNVLVPRAAQSFTEGGTRALRQVVLRSATILGTVMALFCLTTLVLSEQMLRIVFNRTEYEGSGHIVTLLAFGMLAHALGHPVLNGLAAFGRPEVCFRSGALIFGIALVMVPLLVTRWQVEGAAWGFLAGQSIATAVWWLAFLKLVPREQRLAEPR
jgi:O-antigen/teichoic acid export membrane protein